MLKLSTAARTYIPTWNGNDKLPVGERLEVDYKILTVGHLLAIQRQAGINLLSGQAVDLTSPESTEKSWDMMRSVLMEYATEWRGVQVDGEPVTTTERVLELLPASDLILAAEVFNAILSASSGSEEEAKNWPAGSEPASTAISTTA